MNEIEETCTQRNINVDLMSSRDTQYTNSPKGSAACLSTIPLRPAVVKINY